MSPVVRTGLVFGLGAVGVMLGSSLLGLINGFLSCLGFLGMIALGLGAGYTAAKVSNATRDQRIGRGATAGAIAGGIALVLGTIVLIGLASLPFYQAATQAQVAQQLSQLQQQNPELQGSEADLTALTSAFSVAGGVIGAFCSGLFNFVLLLLTGLLGALFWKGTPAYVPAGGANFAGTPTGGFIPNQSGGQTYGNQAYGAPTDPAGGQTYGNQVDQGSARIYDPNDPNRPQ